MLVEWQPSNKTHRIDSSLAIRMFQVRVAEMSMWQLRSALFNGGVFPLSQLTFYSNWVKWKGGRLFQKWGIYPSDDWVTWHPNNPASWLLCLCVYCFAFLPLLLPLTSVLWMWQALCVYGYYARNTWGHGIALSIFTPHHSMEFQALVFYQRGREEKVSRKNMVCEISISCSLRSVELPLP